MEFLDENLDLHNDGALFWVDGCFKLSKLKDALMHSNPQSKSVGN